MNHAKRFSRAGSVANLGVEKASASRQPVSGSEAEQSSNEAVLSIHAVYRYTHNLTLGDHDQSLMACTRLRGGDQAYSATIWEEFARQSG
jgi:hypothetical protein